MSTQIFVSHWVLLASAIQTGSPGLKKRFTKNAIEEIEAKPSRAKLNPTSLA